MDTWSGANGFRKMSNTTGRGPALTELGDRHGDRQTGKGCPIWFLMSSAQQHSVRGAGGASEKGQDTGGCGGGCSELNRVVREGGDFSSQPDRG